MKTVFTTATAIASTLMLVLLAACSSDSSTTPQSSLSLSISAIDVISWEGDCDSAVFELRLSSVNTTGSPIRVLLKYSGTADYSKDLICSLNGYSIDIPNGEQTARFTVQGIADDTLEETETVQFTILGSGSSIADTTDDSTATALIMDDNGPVAVDNEGHIYKSVKIGDQTWLTENLRTIKLRNGDELFRPDKAYWLSDWQDEHVAPCNWDTTKISTYGCMYNWSTVSYSIPIAPSGWHIPTYSEWMTLINHLKGKNRAAGALKEPGTSHWNDPNYLGGMESSGFNALAAGCIGHYGDAEGFGTECYFWSQPTSLEDFYVIKMINFKIAIECCSLLGREGFSIRCIKD